MRLDLNIPEKIIVITGGNLPLLYMDENDVQPWALLVHVRV